MDPEYSSIPMDTVANLQIAHRVIALICPPLGFLLNALFIWLVLVKTPKEMRTHSRILLQTCVLDILLLTILTIVAPLVISVNNLHIVFFNGYLTNILADNISPVFIAYCTVLEYQKLSISAQFLYRYFVLNRNLKIGLINYLCLLILPIISTAIIFITILIEIHARNDDDSNMENDAQQPVAIPYGNIHLEHGMAYTRYWICNLCFLYTLCYSIVAFCGIKMVRFVNAHAQFNERMKSLNRQLTLTLILLATYPLIVTAGELYFLVLFELKPDNGSTMGVQFVTNLFEYSMPIWNPLVSILRNRPYREAVMMGLRCKKINNNQVGPAI